MRKFLFALLLVMMISPNTVVIHTVSARKITQAEGTPSDKISITMSTVQDQTVQKPASSMPVEVKIIAGIVFAIFAILTVLPVVFDQNSSFASVGLLPPGTGKPGYQKMGQD